MQQDPLLCTKLQAALCTLGAWQWKDNPVRSGICRHRRYHRVCVGRNEFDPEIYQLLQMLSSISFPAKEPY